MKKIINVIVIFLLLISILSLSGCSDKKNDNDKNVVNQESINPKDKVMADITQKTDIIIKSMSEYINKTLNFPVNFEYTKTFEKENNKYNVCYDISKGLNSIDMHNIIFTFNEKGYFTNISLIANNMDGLSETEKIRISYVWLTLLSCNSINISETDRDYIMNNLTETENLTEDSSSSMRIYEKTLNGHTYRCTMFSHFDLETAQYTNKLSTINYEINYNY